ncbi:unnamed protein product [Adineta ricciae]|uniref:Uncharacterized protein n=1 Tax=Adineta ricciae TaxID=249248 RepID=A0A814X6P1_ADIRI|nr:unnamed protein product [Adineta ricciae]CAF1604790.1 unnamed protein product [Adineta ricciae]
MEVVPEEQVKPIEITQSEQAPATSFVQALLQEQVDETDEKKKKKKKKAKTGRQRELDRLTKETKDIFETPDELNVVCKRIDSILSPHKKQLLAACRALDKYELGSLSYEQFRLVFRDHLPQLSAEDFFVLTKLFQTDGTAIDYPAILDGENGNGILRHITQLTVPLPTEIILEKKSTKEPKRTSNEPLLLDQTKYVTIRLRLIAFDSFNAYPGHIELTVPDHISVYALSKMVIDKTDFATRIITIFREKTPSPETCLNPMRSLQSYDYTGTYVNGTYKQSFPIYTLYYDYPLGMHSDCPILKCDYYYMRKFTN